MSPEIDDTLEADGPEQPGSRKMSYAVRPDNLELIDDEGIPVRPPRGMKKRQSQGKKEGERLLSVPNIKLMKGEGQSLKDLRDKEDLITSPQPSFTGNFMRRFSKSLICSEVDLGILDLYC